MAAHLTQRAVHRLLVLAGLVLAVVAVHLGAADFMLHQMQALSLARSMPPRMEVVYVREMQLVAPPPRVVSIPVKRRMATPVIVPAASAPAEPEVAAAPMAPEPEPPVAVAEAAPVPVAPAASAAGVPFEWPVSTRMRYVLTGDFRGEVHGQAQVEWIRAGGRYQVHLDVSVGLLASRRMSSDGDITPQGLAPRRYDQETKLAFDTPRRTSVRFEPEYVLLATGQTLPRWPGVQDTVSQFVQLSYLFDSQPERLRVGQVVEIPLAMPRNISVWTYDVVEEETLYTSFGEVQAFHLKPRREPRAGGDMTVEIWIAPQLRHLPVRFRIRPEPEAYFDLMLDRRPELAAPDFQRTPP